MSTATRCYRCCYPRTAIVCSAPRFLVVVLLLNCFASLRLKKSPKPHPAPGSIRFPILPPPSARSLLLQPPATLLHVPSSLVIQRTHATHPKPQALPFSVSIMSAQQASQYPMGHYFSEYNPLPLSTQRRSFDAVLAQEVRAVQCPATLAGYPNYPGHQYSSNYNQPQYPYPQHAPPAPSTSGYHHQHSSSAGSGLSWYSSPTVNSPYTSAAPANESSHPLPSLLSHSFHPHLTSAGTGYHPPLPPHDCPHMDPENYASFPYSTDQLSTAIPESPTHSNPASISPSVSPAEYPSGALAEYSHSLPSAYDDSPRQTLPTSLHDSPSPSTPTASHRMHHSLTSFLGLGGPIDDTMTSAIPTAYQYNLQPHISSSSTIPPTGSNRSRHAHHGSSTNMYSPYNPSKAVSSSSPGLDTPRPHVCGICQAAFHRNHDLKRHKDVHNDTKPYVCQCSRAFTRKDALKRHIFLKSCGKDKGHESA